MAIGVGVQIQEIAEVVRTAVAPVFLLSGVGVTLTLLTNRLARVVDRARALERNETSTHENDMQELSSSLTTLAQRARLLGRSIALCTICALLVSMVVVALFLGAFVDFHLSLVVATLFIVAMLSFIGGLLLFLREVFVATQTLRIGLRRRQDVVTAGARGQGPRR
jgi:F0F1-type ATP synthase assembly protein I